MKAFIQDILWQLLGLTSPRAGKVVLTRRAAGLMLENGVYPELIADAFRYGLEIRPGVIVKKYPQYNIGIYYRYDEAENSYFVTFIYKS